MLTTIFNKVIWSWVLIIPNVLLLSLEYQQKALWNQPLLSSRYLLSGRILDKRRSCSTHALWLHIKVLHEASVQGPWPQKARVGVVILTATFKKYGLGRKRIAMAAICEEWWHFHHSTSFASLAGRGALEFSAICPPTNRVALSVPSQSSVSSTFYSIFYLLLSRFVLCPHVILMICSDLLLSHIL